MSKDSDLRVDVVMCSDAKPLSLENQMQALKGISIDAFVRALQRNEGGKYDRLFLPRVP